MFFYSVDLIKKVFYGISDNKIDIYEFSKLVRDGNIDIPESYKINFADDRISIAVLREVKGCSEKQFKHLIKISKDRNIITGKKELYKHINKTIDYEEELDKYYYDSHK